ncbi:MAG: putative protein YqcC [Candidatus Erwinia impunctatus]|nr:putative protein YqcC [Culicoides impunctatus]
MKTSQQLQHYLITLQQTLQHHALWESVVPDSRAFESSEPFFIDTMSPLQWLQWVFLPRMQSLLDAQQPLPEKLAIAPYYEMALEEGLPGREVLLVLLNDIDALFGGNE